MTEAIRIDERDGVATVLRDIAPGETVRFAGGEVVARDAIGRGHKVALRGIEAGAPVVKYGAPIGRAVAAIAPGEHVHSHNLATLLDGTEEYRFAGDAPVSPARREAATFRGYVRADGRVATRNEVWVLPTVGCVARTAERIARAMDARRPAGIDGVHAFTHPFGCSQLGDDLDATRSVLAGLAAHPNAGGVLIVGLGCEENQAQALIEAIPAAARGRVRVLTSQLSGDEIAEGCTLVEDLFGLAAAERRTVGLDRLVLGVKCGGSDGLSGLTANPLVGRISDRVVTAGGSTVLTEVPEMFGAETLLLARARNRPVFDALATMVDDFKNYFLSHGEPISENPSPGNITGGITTLEEKSLGAVQKGGTAPVADVVRYGGRIRLPGLSVLEAPGNDAVSATALTAAGATMILFTTGRGTPLGFPVPTVKIASNSALAAHKPGWIDIDAGVVLDDGLDAAADALVGRLCAIASGEATAAERNGEREIALWKRGVTL